MARETCRGCPVRQQCLSAGMADPTLSGMWDGTTGRERRRIRERIRLVPAREGVLARHPAATVPDEPIAWALT